MLNKEQWFQTFVGVFCICLGCKPATPSASTSAQAPQPLVAKIGASGLSVSDFEKNLNRQPAYARVRYNDFAKRKEYLETLIQFELLANAATAKGYDRDPDVIRSWRQQAVAKFLQKEIEPKLSQDVNEEELRRYYDSHSAEFVQPASARVSQIVLNEASTAKKAMLEAHALDPSDTQGFVRLVRKYSEDQVSKGRDGDVGFLQRTSSVLPQNVVEGVFALKTVGEISEPIRSPQGLHILRLTDLKPESRRSIDELRQAIIMRIQRERRAKIMDDLVSTLRQQTKITVYEDALKAVRIDEGNGKPAIDPSHTSTGATPSE